MDPFSNVIELREGRKEERLDMMITLASLIIPWGHTVSSSNSYRSELSATQQWHKLGQ